MGERTEKITISATPEEKRRIEEQADSEHRSVSQYLRHLALRDGGGCCE